MIQNNYLVTDSNFYDMFYGSGDPYHRKFYPLATPGQTKRAQTYTAMQGLHRIDTSFVAGGDWSRCPTFQYFVPKYIGGQTAHIYMDGGGLASIGGINWYYFDMGTTSGTVTVTISNVSSTASPAPSLEISYSGNLIKTIPIINGTSTFTYTYSSGSTTGSQCTFSCQTFTSGHIEFDLNVSIPAVVYYTGTWNGNLYATCSLARVSSGTTNIYLDTNGITVGTTHIYSDSGLTIPFDTTSKYLGITYSGITYGVQTDANGLVTYSSATC